MKFYKLILFSMALVCVLEAQAQYDRDALRFSQTDWLTGSTSRMQGLAGAQSSLGGDPSLASTNPAGLGFFNRNAASLTMGLGFQDSDDQFEGLTTANFNNTFVINNASVVLNYNKGRFTEEKFKGGSLGLSVSRVNDFNREFRYEGVSRTSIVDKMLEQAFASGVSDPNNLPELAFAGYNQFLIDRDDSNNPEDYIEFDSGEDLVISPASDVNSLNAYTSPFGKFFSEPYQQEIVTETGNQYEFNISWGGNYNDLFYFGAGIGIQSLYYKRTREYTESDFLLFEDNVPESEWFQDPWINAIRLNDNLVARGGGVNFSFGAIVRPISLLTLGITYESPTFMTINEESDFTLSANWNDYLYYDSLGTQEFFDLNNLDPYLSPINEAQYNLKTPSRLTGGATVFLGKAGFISADAELVDYANAELQSEDFSPLVDNQAIKDNFSSVINYRIGAEFRMDNILFRGGYGLNADPTPAQNDRKHITLGMGYKTADFFVDVAAVNTWFKSQYSPYQFQFFDPRDYGDPTVNSDINNTMITVTAGFNF